MTDLDRAIDVCQRLAETQQNLDVPITNLEREALRTAARLLKAPENAFRKVPKRVDTQGLNALFEVGIAKGFW